MEKISLSSFRVRFLNLCSGAYALSPQGVQSLNYLLFFLLLPAPSTESLPPTCLSIFKTTVPSTTPHNLIPHYSHRHICLFPFPVSYLQKWSLFIILAFQLGLLDSRVWHWSTTLDYNRARQSHRRQFYCQTMRSISSLPLRNTWHRWPILPSPLDLPDKILCHLPSFNFSITSNRLC